MSPHGPSCGLESLSRQAGEASLNSGPSWVTPVDQWLDCSEALIQQPTDGRISQRLVSLKDLLLHINREECCPERLSASKWPCKNSL